MRTAGLRDGLPDNSGVLGLPVHFVAELPADAGAEDPHLAAGDFGRSSSVETDVLEILAGGILHHGKRCRALDLEDEEIRALDPALDLPVAGVENVLHPVAVPTGVTKLIQAK